MNVEVPVEYQLFVNNVIASGTYKSEADVVGKALGLLQDRERRINDLRGEIQPALDRLDRGEGIELDDEGLDSLFDKIATERPSHSA